VVLDGEGAVVILGLLATAALLLFAVVAVGLWKAVLP